MPAPLLDMADRVALAIPRGDDGPADEGKVDLPAVGMTGQGDGDARRDQRKDIGVVRERDDGLRRRNGARGQGGVGGPGVEVG